MKKCEGCDVLILFARYPILGKVKTRLAASIGDGAASAWYRICAEHMFSVARGARNIRTYLFYSEECDRAKIAEWVPVSFQLRQQKGGELGERMANAFATVFSEGACRAAIVGTDIPSLTSEHVEECFTRLSQHDVVIGPANDGGYYLLGLRQMHDELFENVAWSTPRVTKQITAKLSYLQLTHSLLPVLDDIDTIDDLQRWCTANTMKDHPVYMWCRNHLANLPVSTLGDDTFQERSQGGLS